MFSEAAFLFPWGCLCAGSKSWDPVGFDVKTSAEATVAKAEALGPPESRSGRWFWGAGGGGGRGLVLPEEVIHREGRALNLGRSHGNPRGPPAPLDGPEGVRGRDEVGPKGRRPGREQSQRQRSFPDALLAASSVKPAALLGRFPSWVDSLNF